MVRVHGTSEQVNEPDERRMTGSYLSVLAVQVLVLAALWLAGRYFGSS
jgi:hypothetical protein